MNKTANSRATQTRSAGRARDQIATQSAMKHAEQQARGSQAAPGAQPKPVTPVENQLLQLESLAEDFQNELYSIIDPLRPALNYDPREGPNGGESVTEDASCPLEANIIRLKERFQANLSRLRDIHGAIRL